MGEHDADPHKLPARQTTHSVAGVVPAVARGRLVLPIKVSNLLVGSRVHVHDGRSASVPSSGRVVVEGVVVVGVALRILVIGVDELGGVMDRAVSVGQRVAFLLALLSCVSSAEGSKLP